MQFIDPSDINKGLLFDGRLTEDFKLANGTWVSVGPLRAKIIAHCSPLVRDVVITGLDRDFVGAMIFPDVRPIATHFAPSCRPARRKKFSPTRRPRRFQSLSNTFAAESTGSSNRVARAILLEESPSLDAGEITDKGSFNQRAVLDRRAALVEQMYAEEPSANVIRIDSHEPS